MRLNVYTIVYPNGHKIRHYSTEMFIKSVNEFNANNDIKHTMNLNKIHRYTSSASLPTVYQSISKTPMADFIDARGKRLSMVNYRDMFDTVSQSKL